MGDQGAWGGMVGDQPAGIRTPGRHPHNLLDKEQGGDLHHPQPDKLAGFCNLSLKKCIQAVSAWSFSSSLSGSLSPSIDFFA